jgi:hypothetical protein
MFYLAAMADATSRNSYPTHGTRYSRHLYVQSLRSKLQHAALTLRRGSRGTGAQSHTSMVLLSPHSSSHPAGRCGTLFIHT